VEISFDICLIFDDFFPFDITLEL